MSFFNTHTHIFNVPCVPDSFITNYKFPQFLSKIIRTAVSSKPVRKILLGLLKRIPLSVGGIQLRRYAALVEVAINRYQSQIFEDLKTNYSSDARFVVLTMNFDYMSGEAPTGNYIHYDTQLHEVLDAKRMYPNQLLPFLFIDPRRGANECLKQIQYYFDPEYNRGMAGIKIYPSLGYYPFHPAMEQVYAYAEAHQIPIITHSNNSGGAYYAGKFTPQMLSYNSFHSTTETTDYLNKQLTPFPANKSPRFYANIMMHPLVYYDVLRKFKDLKICMAHFGGDEDLINQDDLNDTYNWTRAIHKLMGEFENVYTDVSFTLTNPKTHNRIFTDMANPVLNKKILFGTDFFLTAPYDNDKKLTEKFFGPLLPYKKQLTETNPAKFLTSDFFTS